MKKRELRDQIEYLEKQNEDLKKLINKQDYLISDLRDAAKKAIRFAEDYKYKLIKYTDLTLDQILNLSEEEINDKLGRAIHNKACT